MRNLNEITERDRDLLKSLVNPDDPREKKYNWEIRYQQEVLAMLLCDRVFLIQSMQLIKPGYFVDKAHEAICDILFTYFNKYKQLPAKFVIVNELKERFPTDAKKRLICGAELENLTSGYIPGLESRDACLDKITEFAREQALRSAVSVTLDLLEKNQNDKWSHIEGLFKDALMVDRNFDVGLDYFQSLEDRFDRMVKNQENKEVFVTGFDSIDSPEKGLGAGGICRGEIAAFMGMPGTGKSFRTNTPVLMYDGTIKHVQDVVVGDVVMGPDSKPRNVLARHSFVDLGYEVRPTKGDSYVVNSKHVLSLKNSHRQWNKKDKCYKMGFVTHKARVGDTDIYSMSVEDYLKEPPAFRAKMKGWRVGVDWEEQEVTVNPYILGVWLGDGSSNTAAVCSIDEEVVDELYKEANYRNLNIVNIASVEKAPVYNFSGKFDDCDKNTRGKNTLKNDLRRYNLLYNKHVPYCYKINSREVRLQVLAGLIDSDGSASCGGFDFVNKNKKLAEDVVFLARSLGLAAYMKPCRKGCQTGAVGDYWRVSVSGDCSVVPVRIHRKQCLPREQVKDVLLTGIEVIPTGVFEAFYGFEVDGDHLFLLGDFTVVHNSIMLAKTSAQNIMRGKKVLYLSLEMDQDKIAKRFDAMLAVENIRTLSDNRAEVIAALKDYVKGEEDKRRLIIKQFPAGTVDVGMIRAYLAQLALQGWKPDMMCVDYIGEFKDDPNVKTYESRQRIVRDLRGMATEDNMAIFTAMQPNRSGREAQDNNSVIDDSQLGDSFGQARPLDALWSINVNTMEKQAGTGRIFVVKHRDGRSRYTLFFKQDKDTLDCREISVESYGNLNSQFSQKKTQEVEIPAMEGKKKFKQNGE